MRVVITSNLSEKPIDEIDLSKITDAYYLVLSEKQFESQWQSFKVHCKSNFVLPHIVFITPLIKSVNREKLHDFLSAYIFMIHPELSTVESYA